MDFSSLNQPQREAVETLEGPLLVLAGAGSGKTRVVTFRIVNMLQRQIAPESILGLTFTNKASSEMRERIKKLTHSNVLICTFHSLGARILRESISALGYTSSFIIYDEDDIQKVIKTAIAEVLEGAKLEIKIFRQLISKAKNSLLSPDQVDDAQCKFFPEVYARYQAKLKEYNALDFDDLLFLPVRLFRAHPLILERYQNRWNYLLIDEYQDTNFAQYEMVQQLVAKRHNLCVVGDPDQSIYSWRGANINNILNFEKDYPKAKVVRLEQNYRSTTTILEAANAVIKNNRRRFEKKLWSHLGAGEKIKRFTGETEREEADFVANRIHYHQTEHQVPLSKIVVFYRTNAQSRSFEDVCLQRRIPYLIVGGLSFYQRREVKDILAFLRLVHSGADYVSFNRTINLPKRGLGDATIERFRQAASYANLTILNYCQQLTEGKIEVSFKLSAKQKESLSHYIRLILELTELKEHSSLKDLVRETIEKTSYLNYLKEDKESYEDRKENLDALIAKAAEWEENSATPSLAAFLEELSLHSTLDDHSQTKERLNLMTIHNGKGLEFPVTFLVGLEQELFPHVNSRLEEEGLEEERRLFYVGITRAQHYLYLSDARRRFIWGTSRTQRPSIFLSEIPWEYLEKVRLYPLPSQQSHSKTLHLTPNKMNSYEADIPLQNVQDSFSKGDAIFHKEFGIGLIQEAYQGSLGLTYKIIFSKNNSEKSIVAKYANLLKL